MHFERRLSSRAAAVFLWFYLMVAAALPATVTDRLEAIYQPPRVDRAALSPDGNHAAFVMSDSEGLSLVIYRVAQPTLALRQSLDSNADVHTQFLGWVGPDQLVVATDASLVVSANPVTEESSVVANAATFATGKRANQSVIVRVAGLSESPAGVVLEVNRFSPDSVGQEAVRIDLKTGAQTVLISSHLGAAGGELLADRQGRPRIQFDRNESPQRFNYLVDAKDPVQKPTWQPLDRLYREPPSLAFHVAARDFLGERSIPLGFDFDPNLLYYASNIGRDTYGIYTLDLRTGRRTTVLEEAAFDLADIHRPLADPMLVFDRAKHTLAGVRLNGLTEGTRWIDTGIAQVQTELEQKFPKRQLRLIGWDDARQRFLLLASSDKDAGRYFIYHRSDGRCVEYFRQTQLDLDAANATEAFRFPVPNQGQVTGFLTRPQAVSRAPGALVIWLHDGPWQRIAPGFQADAQALASMGFMVAQINYRGSIGSGRRHSAAIEDSFERIPVEDALLAVEWLAKHFKIDPDRVAIGGEGFGGFVALRAVQLHPEVFKCAVALDAPFDLDWPRKLNPTAGENLRATKLRGMEAFQPPLSFLGQAITGAYQGEFEHQFAKWCFGSAVHPSGSVDEHAKELKRPVLLLHDPQNLANPMARVRRFSQAVAPLAQVMELPPLFLRKIPVTRAPIFLKIGAFLQTSIDQAGAAAASSPVPSMQ